MSAFIACSWIGCWSVSEQATAQEKQTDSKVVTASHTVPVKIFSAPTTAPWEVIGNQPGYVKIQVGRILNHPDLKPFGPMLTTMLDSFLSADASTTPQATPSIKQFGLAVDDLNHVQGGFMVSFRYNPESTDDQRSSLSFGTFETELSATNPVDWPGLINAIDFEKLRTYLAADFHTNGPDDLDKVREAWSKSAQKSRSNVFDTQSFWNSLLPGEQFFRGGEIEPSATKKALWKAVSGGVATVVYNIDLAGEIPKDYQDEDALNQANLEMTIATETVAWGMDLSQDYETCQIRFAAVPQAGVSTDQLLKHFEAVRDALEQSDANDDFSLHLMDQLKKAKVTIVNSKEINGETTKAYLLIEGECSADYSNILHFK